MVSTLVPAEHHPALDVPENERVDYLEVVASMAFADQVVDDAEIARIRDLCTELQLSPAGTDRVLAAARAPLDKEIIAVVERLAHSDLRFALLVDIIDIAYADDTITDEEEAEIEHLAEKLHIDTGQIALVRRYVASKRNLPEGEGHDNELAAPIAGAAVAATAALAASFGLPLVAGLGLAAAFGAGGFATVRSIVHHFREHDGRGGRDDHDKNDPSRPAE